MPPEVIDQPFADRRGQSRTNQAMSSGESARSIGGLALPPPPREVQSIVMFDCVTFDPRVMGGRARILGMRQCLASCAKLFLHAALLSDGQNCGDLRRELS